ncbi:hypothetical protein KC19_12G041100 [Ceratodon purpureus]|uniref:Uncharacterized protein n=1 Tax=Ceratodon purpureus TaxID=3225 RepID=A0A8T0G967_CERPU|nr:hypothetical protein KC19_12G041100 [Ceratodon purpureus]
MEMIIMKCRKVLTLCLFFVLLLLSNTSMALNFTFNDVVNSTSNNTFNGTTFEKINKPPVPNIP